MCLLYYVTAYLQGIYIEFWSRPNWIMNFWKHYKFLVFEKIKQRKMGSYGMDSFIIAGNIGNTVFNMDGNEPIKSEWERIH